MVPSVVPETRAYLPNLLGVLGLLPQWWLLEEEIPDFTLGRPFRLPPRRAGRR